jgi:U3 small nucleolar RNA-associated protein 4
MPVPAATQTPVQLHRIRFLDHTPSPITALAFAPIPLPPPTESDKGKGKFKQPAPPHDELGALVLARENGDVEIWQWAREDEGGVGNWILEKVRRCQRRMWARLTGRRSSRRRSLIRAYPSWRL